MAEQTPAQVEVSKAKAWWAIAGGALMALIPTFAQLADVIPAPWGPALTGVIGVIAAATGRAVYQAPYVPNGHVIVPQDSLPGGYTSTWK